MRQGFCWLQCGKTRSECPDANGYDLLPLMVRGCVWLGESEQQAFTSASLQEDARQPFHYVDPVCTGYAGVLRGPMCPMARAGRLVKSADSNSTR
jgi:hypothetical protein